MARPTNAEISEMDRRTTEVGLFNFADSYLSCAKTLTSQKISGLAFSDPIFYMLYHAIELYLKAHLRLKGIGAYQLASRAYGHNLDTLSAKAAAFGLTLDARDTARIQHLQAHQLVIDSRYINTGYRQMVPLEAVQATAQRIRDAVQAELIAAGRPTRPGPLLPSVSFDTSYRRLPQVSDDA